MILQAKFVSVGSHIGIFSSSQIKINNFQMVDVQKDVSEIENIVENILDEQIYTSGRENIDSGKDFRFIGSQPVWSAEWCSR